MKNNILNSTNFKFINDYKYFLISISIFIIYSLDLYLPRGWSYYNDNWGVDQSLIENIARKFVEGESLVGHLSHGIGYPLVIAPFLYITSNPLNIAGFFLFTITANVIFQNLDQVVKEKKLKIFIIFSLIISFAFSPDMKFWVIGASNSLTALLILLTILWSVSPKVPKSLPTILGLLSGLVFSARYVDYIFLFPLYLSALINYSKIYNLKLLNNLLLSFLISLIFIIPTFILHKAILGDWFTTPYHGKPSDVIRLKGFATSEASLSSRFYDWIIPNLYSTLISYKSFASNLAAKGQPTALLICPILYLTPYSLCNLIFSSFDKPLSKAKKQINITILCTLFSLIIWMIFYASGWAYTSHDLLFQCLRYFMGWFSLIIFVTLYGLTIKPKIKTFLLATFLYVILFNYPTLYLKSEFKGVNIIEKIQVYKNGFEDFKKEYKLPIPFDLGKKSLLAIAGNDVILGVNNHSNNIFLGECNLKNLNTKSFQENFKYCKFYDSDQQYLSEEGMDFLGIEKKNGFYQINYKILENDIPIIKNFIVGTLKFKTIEDKGSISLIEDDLNRFRIKEPKKRFYYLKRNNVNYMNNMNNQYWPDWKIIAAERIENKNQILTTNEKNKIYCIWELDKKWNYKKDRLCSEFKSSEIGKHEEEFDIDINNDRYINSYLIRENSSIKNNTNRLYAFKFKINPIKFEKNNFIINAKVNSINNKNSELNIKLTKTGDQISDTFPSSISLSCGSEFESCTPFKTGRFNNLWRIWIKNINSYESIEFATEEIKRNPPSFWPIQYLTFKS